MIHINLVCKSRRSMLWDRIERSTRNRTVDHVIHSACFGAAAGLKDTAERAIKDGYGALKPLIQRKCSKVDSEHPENAPESGARRAVVAEDLQAVGALGNEGCNQRSHGRTRHGGTVGDNGHISLLFLSGPIVLRPDLVRRRRRRRPVDTQAWHNLAQVQAVRALQERAP